MNSFSHSHRYASDIPALWRDLQIRIIEGYQFKVDENQLKKFLRSDIYKAYDHFTPGEIITGSTALNIFGLLQRESTDIDIVIHDKEKYKKLKNRSGDYSDGITVNYIGSKVFSKRVSIWNLSQNRFQFDFFQFDNNEFIFTNGLKIETPYNIIKKKIDIAAKRGFSLYDKHFQDLEFILNV